MIALELLAHELLLRERLLQPRPLDGDGRVVAQSRQHVEVEFVERLGADRAVRVDQPLDAVAAPQRRRHRGADVEVDDRLSACKPLVVDRVAGQDRNPVCVDLLGDRARKANLVAGVALVLFATDREVLLLGVPQHDAAAVDVEMSEDELEHLLQRFV